MPVVSFINQKGGVGKTSFTYHMAGAMAVALERRVLVIDTDPQCNLTHGFWDMIEVENLDSGRTVSSILRGDFPHPDLVIHSTGVPGIDIIPGSATVAMHNGGIDPRETPFEVQSRCRYFLDGVTHLYDYVLIDCPPSMQFCSWAALAASDYMVVPVQPERSSTSGIKAVIDFMMMARSSGHPVRFLGLVLSMVMVNQKGHQMFEHVLRREYGEKVFRSRVKRLADINDAYTFSQTIHQYKPGKTASQSIQEVAEEIEARIHAASGGGEVAA